MDSKDENDLINIKGSKKKSTETSSSESLYVKKKRDIPDAIPLDTSIINNWTETNANTLRTWKGSMSQALFIYKKVLEALKSKLNKYKIALLIFSTLTTLVAAIASYALVSASTQANIYTALGINIFTIIIGAISTVLNGIIKIFNLDDLVASYTLYIERLDNLYSTVANQLTLPVKIREDAFVFIKSQNEIYLKLIKESPVIASSDYNFALELYRQYLKDNKANITFYNSYNNNDNIIEVV